MKMFQPTQILRVTDEMIAAYNADDTEMVKLFQHGMRMDAIVNDHAAPALFDGNEGEDWPFATPASLCSVEERCRYGGGFGDLYCRLSWPLGIAWDPGYMAWCNCFLTEEDARANDWIPFEWLNDKTMPLLLASDRVDAMTKLRLAARWAEAKA